jgi:hypothetical protein
MEDDVGIDSSGLDSFASCFCDAILARPNVEEEDSDYYPLSTNSSTLGLKLRYNIGSMEMEGVLKFSLVSKTSDPMLFELIKLSYNIDPAKQVSRLITSNGCNSLIRNRLFAHR